MRLISVNAFMFLCLRVLTLSAVSIGLLSSPPCIAQPAPKPSRPDISGEITLESTEERKTAPFALTRDAAIDYINKVDSVVKQLAQGGAATLEPADEFAIPYLNAAYLFCSVQEGICKHLLDTLLESDIIISKQSSKAQCPNLTRFWKSYIAGDLEGRHKFLTQVAYMSTSAAFNEKVRPRYLRCRDTVTKVLETETENFFVTRYKDSEIFGTPAKSAAYLKNLKDSDINPFSKTGIGLK